MINEKEMKRFWGFVSIGFIIMVLAVGLSLVVGLTGMAGLIMSPEMSMTWLLTLVVIMISTTVASFFMGMAAKKITK